MKTFLSSRGPTLFQMSNHNTGKPFILITNFVIKQRNPYISVGAFRQTRKTLTQIFCICSSKSVHICNMNSPISVLIFDNNSNDGKEKYPRKIWINDTHMEKLNSVKEFINVKSWLLIFSICLRNELKFHNSIEL